MKKWFLILLLSLHMNAYAQGPIVTAPAAVSGTFRIAADATDNVGVVGVQFYLDGVAIGAEEKIQPYEIFWDSHQTTNGEHQLTANARDAAGNVGVSAPVAIQVLNTPATKPTNLTAVSTGTSVARQILLKWTSTDTGTVFIIQRRVSPVGPFVTIAETKSKSYFDGENIHSGTRYTYRVYSSIGSNVSNGSNEAGVTTP